MDWALATSPPNAEHLLAADLARAGYQHRFFKREVSRAFHGKITTAFRPAFPRYVFIDHARCFDVVRDVWRALGVVAFGEEIAKVHEGAVDELVARCGGGDVLPREEIPELYAHGQRIHIGGVGLFAGYNAVYDRLIDDGKVRVMVDMMGRMVPLDVDVRDVRDVGGVSIDKPKRRYRGPRKRNRGRVK